MTRPAILAAAALTLAACSAPLTPQQLAVAQAGITVVDATVPGASNTLAAGQLLCQAASTIVAVVDATTGKPYLVTGKPAQTVANACALVGSSYAPVAPPVTPTTVAVVKVSASA